MDVSISEIIYTVDRAVDTLGSKGWYVYSGCRFNIGSKSYMEFVATIRPPYDSEYNSDWRVEDNINIKESCSGIDDLIECKNRFISRINAHQTLHDYVRNRYRQRLVDLVDEGERLGFALEYVEVLRATAKKLASNALTQQS